MLASCPLLAPPDHSLISFPVHGRVQPCYNELKDGEIIALAETAVRKADLKRKKNDEQAEASREQRKKQIRE